MRKTLGFIFLYFISLSCLAIDGNTVLIQQVDPTGSYQQTRFLSPPSVDSYIHYDPSTNLPGWSPMSSVSMASSQISDTSAVGRDLMTAASKSTARSAIDAGTSNFSGSWSDISGTKKTSDLVNDSGFITSAPVTSVNSYTGAVTLSASDIGAASTSHTHTASQISDSTTIGRSLIAATNQAAVKAIVGVPTATSQLTNDSGFITSSPVTSVNSKTGAVSLTYADIGADQAGLAASAQAYAIQRGNQTGTQTASTISDFNAAADARITTSNSATATFSNKTISGSANTFTNIPYSALSGAPTVQAIQRIRVQTNSTGDYTWTYPVAYSSGVVPIISAISESASSTVPQGVQIVGVPTNTSATFKVINLPSTSVLSVVVLGAPAGAQAYIHLTAIAP